MHAHVARHLSPIGSTPKPLEYTCTPPSNMRCKSCLHVASNQSQARIVCMRICELRWPLKACMDVRINLSAQSHMEYVHAWTCARIYVLHTFASEWACMSTCTHVHASTYGLYIHVYAQAHDIATASIDDDRHISHPLHIFMYTHACINVHI